MVKHLFALLFEKVDMFDNNSKAIAAGAEMKQWNPVIQRIEVERFETWQWRDSYDAIFLTWSAGYINDESLSRWLKTASKYLNNSKRKGSKPSSFIYWLDNIAPEREAEKENGQWLRPIKTMKSVIHSAGLKIYRQTKPTMLHADYGKVMLMLLY